MRDVLPSRGRHRTLLSRLVVGNLFAWTLFGCEAEEPPRPTAEVGVFYGGQVRLAEHIEVSTVKPPKIGFRVDLPVPDPSQTLTYELVRPGPAGRRVTKKGKFSVSADQSRIDHVFDVDEPGRLGIWNVRVIYGDLLLADRALYLTPKSAGSP